MARQKKNLDSTPKQQSKDMRKTDYQYCLAYLVDLLEPPFLKTAAVKLLEEKFAWDGKLAKEVFEALVNEGSVALVAGTRRYEVKENPLGWTSGTVYWARNGSLMFVPEDETEEKAALNVHGDFSELLLPGDTVWAKRNYKMTYNFQGLRRRQSDRVICTLGPREWTDFAVATGPNTPPVRIAVGDVNRAELKGKIFVVKLDEECTRPFFMGTYLSGQMTEVLGEADDADVEIDIALRRFNLPYEFSEEALAQTQKLPDEVAPDEVKTRVDLRDVDFVTIDGEDARDFDDAVWCTPIASGFRLLVAIADVSHYVTQESPLDRDAQTRLTSVYFPRRVIPMLPEKLSNGLCSLNPDVDRCTIVCDMTLDEKGTVTAYQFYPALIHSKARLTYTAVWSALQGDDALLLSQGGTLSDVSNLYSLYQTLREARKERGAIDFESVETEIVCDPQTKAIIAIKRRDHNDAHRLIEECMLAANVCAADFIGRHRAKCLYRVHDLPSADRLTTLRDTLRSFGLKLSGGDKPKARDFDKVTQAVKNMPYADVIQNAMLRTMQQAVYSPENIGHYGLNYEAYTHFTSPIRRYPDLLVHRTIRAILNGEKYLPKIVGKTADLMDSRAAKTLMKKQREQKLGSERVSKSSAGTQTWETLGLMASAAERRADEASRDVVAWLKCKYMQQYVGKSFTGVITAVIPAGVFVMLKNLFVEGFVHVSRLGPDYYFFDDATMSFSGEFSRERFKIGDKITVEVSQVDMDNRTIDFTRQTVEPERVKFKRNTRTSKHRNR